MSFDNEQWRQFVEEVRRLSPIDIIVKDSGTKIERHGRLLKCLSPLRKERTASFFIYPEQGTWWDFGPGRGGDVFAFIMEKNCCDFRHAVDYLAERCGKKWEGDPELAKKLAQDRQDSERLFNLIGIICNYYYQNIPDDVRSHLNNHYGITNETIDQLKIGWCDGLSYEHFLSEGYSESQIISTGFFYKSADEENIRDFFVSRIIFPYWVNGKAVYAIGRRFEGKTPDTQYENHKYKKIKLRSQGNKAISELITNKWYNEDILSSSLPYIVITEGVTDCIAFMQAGIPSISPVTTSFKNEDYPRLASIAKDIPKVYLCNDEETGNNGRKPGLEGSKKTAEKLFKEGIDVRICRLPKPDGVDKVDVNEFLRDKPDPMAAWEEVKAKAIPYPTFILQDIPENADRIELPKLLGPWLETISHLEYMYAEPYIEEAAKRFSSSIGKTVLSKKFKELQSEKKKNKKDEQPQDKKDKKSKQIGSGIHEGDKYYFEYDYDGNEEIISSFTLEPVYIAYDEDEKDTIVCNIHINNGRIIPNFPFPKEAWSNKNNFIRYLPSVELQWLGSDKATIELMGVMISKGPPKIRMTKSIGYKETENGPRFVLPFTTISAEGTTMLQSDILLMMNRAKSFVSNAMKKPDDTVDVRVLAKETIPHIIRMADPRYILPILGHCFATIFKTRLKKHTNFPILNVWGGPGTGKSTITQLIWQLQGAKHNADMCNIGSKFSFLSTLSESTDTWVVYDEFRLGSMDHKTKNSIYEILRSNYNQEVQVKGTRELTTVTFKMDASVVIVGESKLENDKAVADRAMYVCADQFRLTEKNEQHFKQIENVDLSPLGFDFIKWSMTQSVDDKWEQANNILRDFELLNGNASSKRQRKSILVILFGMICFDKWAEDLLGDHLPELIEANEVVKILLGDTNRDLFDEIVTDWSTMASMGILREGDHYSYSKDMKTLNISFAPSLALWRSWKKSHDTDDAEKSKSAIRSIMKTKLDQPGTYVVYIDHQIYMTGFDGINKIAKNTKCVVIDVERVTETLQIDAFPSSKAKNKPSNESAPN